MKVVHGKPPDLILERCQAAFDLTDCDPVFTYAPYIYHTGKSTELDPFLVAHESVHEIQQGDKPQEWWDRFLQDKDFRFEQELQAYRVQYKTAKQLIKNRDELAKLLVSLASDFSGPQYGNMCTLQEAIGLIRE